MKKLLAIVLVLAMCFTMAACSKPSTKDAEGDKAPVTDAGVGDTEEKGGAIDGVVTVYENLLNAVSGQTEMFGNAEVSVNLSEDALTALEQLVFGGDTQVDLDWINALKIGMDMGQKGDLMAVAMKLGMSDVDVISMEMIVDAAMEKAYVALPELNDKYISMPFEGGEMPAWMTMFTESSDEFMPEGETVGKLLEKYIGIVKDNVTWSEKETVELTVGDVTKSISVQELVINEELAAKVMTAVLTAAKTDADIKKIIDDFRAVAVADYGMDDMDLYGSYVEAIDVLLADIPTADFAEETLGTVSLYTDGEEIAGIALEIEGEEITCLFLTDGGKTALELNVVDSIELVGSGTVSGDLFNATYELKAEGIELFDIKIVDYDVKKAEQGGMSGTIRLLPKNGLYTLLPSAARSLIESMDLGLEFVMEATQTTAETTMNVLAGDTVYVGITIKETISETGTITVPSADKVVDSEDDEALLAWMESLDTEAIFENLTEAGLSSDLVDLLEILMTGMMEGGSSYDDGYYDDGYYDDYYTGDYTISYDGDVYDYL